MAVRSSAGARRPRSRRRARGRRRRRRAAPGRPDRDGARRRRVPARRAAARARGRERRRRSSTRRATPAHPSVAVYEEVEADQVTVFVRDRGRGFDPAAVPTDRGGIAESITGRMQRQRRTRGDPLAPGPGHRGRALDEAGVRRDRLATGRRACSSSTTTTCSAAACGPSWATTPTWSARRPRSTRPSR